METSETPLSPPPPPPPRLGLSGPKRLVGEVVYGLQPPPTLSSQRANEHIHP